MSSSDDDESYGETREFKDDLLEHICSITSTGSFAAFEMIKDFVNPGVAVDSPDCIRLPLSADDARYLIQRSDRAPFGLGTRTLVDESVRKTSQIDAGKVQFLNEKWPLCLKRITEKVAAKLGVADAANVQAEFYKMLIYEKGAMFKPHKDTEKIPGMFATLAICLPSRHTGGSVELQHGNKTVQFATSEFSRFDASFVAWYADVTHEIKPVESGYRWVLVYNLVNVDPKIDLSAGALTARVQEFGDLLNEWQGLSDPPQFLVHSLAHKYTHDGLTLARLKGEDYCRARHVAQSCAEHGGFQVLLANMELRVTDPQSEDCELESALYLTRIVDLGGFDLSVYKTLAIAKTALLEYVHDDRDPDVQRGGGYVGNQHEEIHQFYTDSVLLIVPSRAVASLLLGGKYSHTAFDSFMGKLRESVRMGAELSAMPILVETCHNVLKRRFSNIRQKDLDLGTVAVSAMFLHDAVLFTEAVTATTAGYDSNCYAAFGKMIDLQDFVVSKDDIAEALSKNGKLDTTISNLQSLRAGFHQGNADRDDGIQSRQLQHWLDSIVFDSLATVPSASADDARALVTFIIDCDARPFNQFVVYQGARQFVDRFSSNAAFTIPFTIEALESPMSPKPFLTSLLDRLLSPAITHFDLQVYASYSTKRRGRDGRPSNPGGPIKSLYARLEAYDSGLTAVLLTRIQTQAADLAEDDCPTFLLPFLSELVTVLDTSSTLAQECVHALLTTWLIKKVGMKPEKPQDWSRPGEIKRECRRDCEICTQMNKFLANPKAKSCKLSCEEDWHVKYGFPFIEVARTAVKNEVMLTKTLKQWERDHREWRRGAEEAVKQMEKLPLEKLRDCLTLRLDGILNLKVVKVAPLAARGESMGEGSHRYTTRSTVAQKRALG